jgi:hypothetical protein
VQYKRAPRESCAAAPSTPEDAQKGNPMTISQLEELFLKETGVVSPYKETTPAEGQGPRGARQEAWNLWLKKYTRAAN